MTCTYTLGVEMTGHMNDNTGCCLYNLRDGLLVYISNRLPYTRSYDLENIDIESIWIQINFKDSKPFLVGFIYRPPNSSQLQLVDDLKLETHFLGDMNIHYNCDTTSKKSFDNQKWCDVVNKYGYLQLVMAYTVFENKIKHH